MRPTALLIAALATTSLSAASIKYTAPAGWVSRTPASTARLAEWNLPKAGADTEDGLVTLYFFGANMGGNAQANIDRWIGQMSQPDGKASKDVAKTSAGMTISGLRISSVDVTGTYVAEVTPGSAEHYNKSGWRQIAALIETPGGPHFVKVIGPAATIAKWEATVTTFIRSISYE
ncbi:MAG: hypothetical protein EPO35_12515 [Acidobacteria bacterium]|nr:MAG: hypothetical protein EPO35_12515 [Acidobacteriota bacterium]